MRLVIFGPQGAGKGTQSARIAERYKIPAISTGDIFRAAMSSGSELGGRVLEFVNSGRLVPDELTNEVVRERLSKDDVKNGFLLDGFPRNVAQAEALDGWLAEASAGLDGALVLEIPEEVSLRRIMGRRVCANCGANYHVDVPPAKNWTCDRCGGPVGERADDQDEGAIRARLQAYFEQTEPLKEYYARHGLLKAVNGGGGTPDEVFDRIVAVL